MTLYEQLKIANRLLERENERLKAQLVEVSEGLSDAARGIVLMTKEIERLKARLKQACELAHVLGDCGVDGPYRCVMHDIEAQWVRGDEQR